MVDEYINPKAFILIKGKKDMKNKIEYRNIKLNINVFFFQIFFEKF